jgi:hypothetical protein
VVEVRPLGKIGAEIAGVDVKTLDDTTFGVVFARERRRYIRSSARDYRLLYKSPEMIP